jgi:hypothetical protein
LPTANQLEDHSHGSVGDATTAVARIDLLLLPQLRQATVVRMTLDQVFGDEHCRAAQLSIALTNEWAIGVIDLIALITRREQPGSSVNRVSRRVMLDRPGFSSQPRCRNHVNAGLHRSR